jgi:two-component system alkaline phosphatase synthesis response regulator PhoP
VKRERRILLIDDDRDFVEATCAVLESVPYDVDVAYGGDEGLLKVRQVQPDLILLDILMPTKDGFQVYEVLKKDPDLARIPVVMLTSLPDVGLKSPLGQKGVTLKAEDYIEKPVKPAELLKRLKKLLPEGR